MRYFPYLKKSYKIFYKHRIMPEHITFFVTNRCNARCKHCFCLKHLNSGIEMSLEEIKRFSQTMGGFLFLLLTGGEPFMRTDLPRIIEAFYKNNGVRKMTIVTNGHCRIPIDEIMSYCPGLYLTINVSLDGIGELHDSIRNVKGAYQRAVETISLLNKARTSQLLIGVNMTYSSYNQDKIIDIYNHIKRNIRVDLISCCFFRGDNGEARPGRIDNYIKLQKIIKEDTSRESFLENVISAGKAEASSLLIKTLKGRYVSPCYAGRINAVIYPDGDVFACELLDEKMGNLRGNNFRKIWLSPRAEQIRKKIKESKCFCTHECNLIGNVLYNPVFLGKMLLKLMITKER